jgi:hypothetical protein
MKYAAPLFAAVLLLSACETIPASAPPAEAGVALDGDLDLGDWRAGDQATTQAAFEQNASGRYRVGLTLASATADLRRSEFNCGDAPPLDEQGRGDPPAQVCRRTITQNGCTHTWQVHLFGGDDANVSRTRGLYDRRCGNEGLLGGPG